MKDAATHAAKALLKQYTIKNSWGNATVDAVANVIQLAMDATRPTVHVLARNHAQFVIWRKDHPHLKGIYVNNEEDLLGYNEMEVVLLAGWSFHPFATRALDLLDTLRDQGKFKTPLKESV